MNRLRILTLLLMIAMAIILAIIMLVSYPPGGTFVRFIGFFGSLFFLAMDLIVIVSFIFTILVLKPDTARKTVNYTLKTFAFTIAAIIFVTVLFNPLHWPKPLVREYILWKTPIGMDMQDVIEVVEGRDKWEVWNINYKRGYVNYDKKAPPGRPTSGTGYLVVGNKSIKVILGKYSNPFLTIVSASWGFDEEGKLIDVYVRKTTDVF